jgi:hypothetical protein
LAPSGKNERVLVEVLHETAAQNVRKSQQYDYLVATNSSFLANRMRRGCGPIRDTEMHSQ